MLGAFVSWWFLSAISAALRFERFEFRLRCPAGLRSLPGSLWLLRLRSRSLKLVLLSDSLQNSGSYALGLVRREKQSVALIVKELETSYSGKIPQVPSNQRGLSSYSRGRDE